METLAQHMFHWELDEYGDLKVNKLYCLRLDEAH